MWAFDPGEEGLPALAKGTVPLYGTILTILGDRFGGQLAAPLRKMFTFHVFTNKASKPSW